MEQTALSKSQKRNRARRQRLNNIADGGVCESSIHAYKGANKQERRVENLRKRIEGMHAALCSEADKIKKDE